MYNEYFFILDALRADHLKYMPWLNSKINDGIFSDNYTISEGFCERIEIFTGQKPFDHGFVTAFTLEYNNKFIYPYSWLSPSLAKYLSLIEINTLFTKIIRRILWKMCSYFSKYPIYPQRIPLNILHKVGITEDSFNFEKLSKKNKSGLIFKLKEKGFKIEWSLFTSSVSKIEMSDDQRLNDLLNYKTKNKLFIPIYISVPDKYGHEFGPHTIELIDSLKDLDKKCKATTFELLKSNSKSAITFIGDHGMDLVTQSINIDAILLNIESITGLKRFFDFDFFLDSTIFRLWWRGKSEDKYIFLKHLQENEEIKKKGYVIGPNNLEKVNMDLSSIANFVWWAKKGIIINPDFYHKSDVKLKGMHGYLEKDNPSSGFFLRIKDDLKQKKYIKIKSYSIDKLF